MPFRSYLYASIYILTGAFLFTGLIYRLFVLIHLGKILPILAVGALLVGCLLVLLLVCSILLPSFNLGFSAFCRGSSHRKWVALTFDDGPNEPFTSQVLDILKQYGISATFFVVGENVERHPDLVRRALQEGHAVGNHTFDHRPLIFMSREEIEKEFQSWEKAMERVKTLLPEPKIFRAPRGWKSPFLNSILKEKGYHLVGWTRGVWDTDRPGIPVLFRRITRRVSNGEIILLHDGEGNRAETDRSQTVGVLKEVIEYLQNLDFRFVTIPEMMS